jgi:hypothetical protein
MSVMNVMMKEQAWNEKAFDSARMGRRRKSKECIILAEEVLGMPPRTTETCIIDRAMLMLAADCLSSMLEHQYLFLIERDVSLLLCHCSCLQHTENSLLEL